MRAVQYHDHGGPDVLQVDEIERPEPDATEVLVHVEATSVNPLDTYLREGSYEPVGLPMIPGVDFAGVVESVGANVDEFTPGDRVFGTGLGRDRIGANAEYAIAPLDRIALLPDDVSFVAGGALGNVAVTAWRALVHYGDLTPGDTCLIHGGNGGVGHVGVQLAARTGADVIATSAPAYHDRLRELGADTVLDYQRDDLQAAVENVTGGEGVEVILDIVLDEYLQFDINVAATFGRIVSIGGGHGTIQDPALARAKDVRIQPMTLYNIPDIVAVLDRLAKLLVSDALTLEIERTYDLEGVGEAHYAVMEESFLGKLAVEP